MDIAIKFNNCHDKLNQIIIVDSIKVDNYKHI